jgi:hypothetical protein
MNWLRWSVKHKILPALVRRKTQKLTQLGGSDGIQITDEGRRHFLDLQHHVLEYNSAFSIKIQRNHIERKLRSIHF